MRQTILDAILETKRKEVHALYDQGDLAAWKARAAGGEAPRDFFAALTRPPARLLNLIAEVKRASPSAGIIREDFDPVAIARQYEAAGAGAISVLTDEQYFQGCLDYLRAVREAVGIPVLRKDFIIDPAQVCEARAAGADAILLIAAALPADALADLMRLARELGMAALVEAHSADELRDVLPVLKAAPAGSALLGINNRDLATFNVDVRTTVRLAGLAGGGLPVVSESGIRTRADVELLRGAGVRAVLVGETLMRADDISPAIEALLGPAGD